MAMRVPKPALAIEQRHWRINRDLPPANATMHLAIDVLDLARFDRQLSLMQLSASTADRIRSSVRRKFGQWTPSALVTPDRACLSFAKMRTVPS